MVRTKHRIGGYRVIAPIGAGGFSTVYRALNESNGQEVAIKVLAENHSLIAETRRRFDEEVDLLSTVDHPSIAKLYEVGETENNQPYMVLELADRGDLRRRLEEIRGSHQVLNRADLTMLAHHLYDSLTALHRAEIIHRDVSPGNILIRSRRTPGERAKDRDGAVTLLEPGERFLLADLGHAKDLIRASGFTAGGGTKGFASPEQRDDITVVDLRTDIFSATAIIEWAAHDGEFADDLEPFYDIGLAAEPDDRFDSMTEWHTAFSAALGASDNAHPGGFLSLAGVTDFLDEKYNLIKPGRPDRRVMVMAGAAVAMVLAGIVTIGAVVGLDGGSDAIEAEAESEFRSVAISVTDDQPPLVVTAADGQPGATTTGPSSTIDAEDGTTGVSAETTQPEPAVSDSNGTTIDPSTTNPSTGDGPITLDAEVDTPANGAVVSGNLTITGRATFPDDSGSVELMIKNLETEQYWTPSGGGFQDSFNQFRPTVNIQDSGTTWAYTITDTRLEPGRYLIRVWARGPNGEGVPRSDSHTIVVS